MWCQAELNLLCLPCFWWVLGAVFCQQIGPCGGDLCGRCDKAPGAGLAQPKGAECSAQRVCLLPAAWEVWALKKNTPGREKEGGGEKEGAGGRDERLQQAESRSGNVAVPILAGYLTAATEEGQRQEEVSIWTGAFLLCHCKAGGLLRCFNVWSIV